MKPALTYQRSLFEAPVLDIKEGARLRDMGIKKAEDSAERKEPGWNEKVYEMFRDWLSGWPVGFTFRIEEFRQVANIKGLPEPPSLRAFGGLALKAKHAGLIKSVGIIQVKNPQAHMANASLWQKL